MSGRCVVCSIYVVNCIDAIQELKKLYEAELSLLQLFVVLGVLQFTFRKRRSVFKQLPVGPIYFKYIVTNGRQTDRECKDPDSGSSNSGFFQQFARYKLNRCV